MIVVRHGVQESHLHTLRLLRVLQNGYKIGVAVTKYAPATGVDTQADLDFVRSVWK